MDDIFDDLFDALEDFFEDGGGGLVLALLLMAVTLLVARARRDREQVWPRGIGSVSADPAWPGTPADTEITRLLCRGVYHSARFAKTTTALLFTGRLTAAAHSPGVDTVLVALHCLTVLRIKRRYRNWLVGVLVFTVGLTLVHPVGLIGLVAGAVVVRLRRGELESRAAHLERGRFRDGHGFPLPAPEWAHPRLHALADAQKGNVTIFLDRPFVGCGKPVDGWSFALAVRSAEDTLSGSPAPLSRFSGAELTAYVSARLADAADRGSPLTHGVPLVGLVLADRVFADGGTLIGNPALLPDRAAPPVQTASAEDVQRWRSELPGPVRTYLCVHAASSAGLVVASTFLRFTAHAELLYFECERTLLHPVGADLLLAESEPGFLERASVWLGDVVSSPLQLVAAPFTPIPGPTRRSVRRTDRKQVKAAIADPHFHYGAGYSPREAAAAASFHTEFQFLDAERSFKLVERLVLDAAIEFLDHHGVDTSDLRSRQTTILNSGVIQTGGVSNVGALAVGDQARATQHTQAKAAR
ncbi:hypothetical protein [Actinokineospora sp. NPDC004072]